MSHHGTADSKISVPASPVRIADESTGPYRPQFGQPIEHAVVRALLVELRLAGFVPCKVWDEAEYVTARTEREVLDAVFSVVEPGIHFAPASDPDNWGRYGVGIVVGNGEHCLADWHCGLGNFSAAVDRVLAAIEHHYVVVPTSVGAGPDLLEAAQQAEYWLSQPDRSIEPVEMLRVLRAAIAKAEAA